MFDYRTEMLVRRLERERRLKAISLTAARAGDRSASRTGLRAGVAAGLTRLALIVHREAAADAVAPARRMPQAEPLAEISQ